MSSEMNDKNLEITEATNNLACETSLEPNKEFEDPKILTSDARKSIKPRSRAWSYFTKDAVGQKAVCQFCHAEVSCKDGNTTAIRLHLERKHPEQQVGEIKTADEFITHISDRPITQELENNDISTVRLKEQKALNEVERQLTEGVALFWQNKAFSDVEIHCGLDGGVVQSHRIMLAALSPFLRYALQSLSTNETDAVLLIPDINSQDINNFLNLVCKGSTEEALILDALTHLGFSYEAFSNSKTYKAKTNITPRKNTGNTPIKNEHSVFSHDDIEYQQNDYEDYEDSYSNVGESAFVSLTDDATDETLELDMSWILSYFIAADKQRSICKTCSATCRTDGGSTSGLIRHLRNSHPKKYKEFVTAKKDKETCQKNMGSRQAANVQQNLLPSPNCGKSSLVWNYFTSLENDRTKCNACDQVMRTFDGSTSGMLRHLRRNHEDVYADWKAAKEKRNIMTVFSNSKHPIWQYYEELETNKYNCLVCSNPVELADMQMILLEEHLKEKHSETFKTYTAKLNEEKMQMELQDQGGGIFGAGGSHGKFSRVWAFYDEVGSEKARCRECNVVLRVFSNSTSGLLRHIKRHHDNLYLEFIRTRKKRIPDPSVMEDNNHPIWTRFNRKDQNTSLAACAECNTEIEMQDLELTPLESHLKNTHTESFQQYESSKEEYCSKLRPKKDIKFRKMGMRSAIWHYFQRTDDRNLNECSLCENQVRCNKMGTSNMIRHLERYHTNEHAIFLKENSGTMPTNGTPIKTFTKGNKMKKKRGPKPKTDEIDPNERTCPDCGKVFSGRAAMRFHQRVVHSGVRPFKCDECGMTFARGDSFKGHTHSKMRSFLCTICGKTFGRKNIRDQHERAHRGDRRYNCNFCSRKFMTNQQRMNHERVHTGEKPYQCTDCGRQFAQQHQLTTHYRIHTGEKPYDCAYCTQKFRHLSSRNNHKCEGKSSTAGAGHAIVTSSDLTTTAAIANATIQWVESD